MNMLRKNILISIRESSKLAISLDGEFLQKLEKGEFKPKRHPGIQKRGETLVPKWIESSLLKCIGDRSLKKLIDDGKKLNRHIVARHPPPEKSFIRNKLSKIEQNLEKFSTTNTIQNKDNEERNQYNNERTNKIKQILKKQIFAWKPINYGEYESLVYAVGRSALEFTILAAVFTEIKNGDHTFKPRSFFDFGSGVGTGMWVASNLWNNTLLEYYNVDSSRNMNDLAESILREGNSQQIKLNKVFFRQFLPAKTTQYDLVLSSFALFELNSKKSRAEVILNLWKRCANYLIFIEEGTRKGFELIAEARDLILSARFSDPLLEGYVFAPCPHQHECPRLTNNEDKTPCNYEIKYEPFSLLGKSGKKLTHLYSYVVIKKGPMSKLPDYSNWQRIVRPTLVKTRHTICRMCTSHGTLQEVIFTPSKHGKLTYQCGRSSCWGDKLPLKIQTSK
ncbi:methyltransferase-like protein 17, mitochondrial [Condylostylus longicornis]|uniref:methyltransferase-like protein 17, mitochondrial n=1 Tax=Condylostylus longicornis TaxID=2530218 RepID=UPI00244E0492|nr:methyltransferase-like protein 17, mitochondrial [Condylostylus longicornis]